jgi:hypothetical protein
LRISDCGSNAATLEIATQHKCSGASKPQFVI